MDAPKANGRIFASVAHRGSANFLHVLVSDVEQALNPARICVFSAASALGGAVSRERLVSFYEPERDLHGRFGVLRRFMDCFQHIATHYATHETDALVAISSNQRFFQRCYIEPNTFSYAPLSISLANNAANPFRAPVDYPSSEWNRAQQLASSKVHSIRSRFVAPPATTFLHSHAPKDWKHIPLVTMPMEGSFYPMSLLKRFKPLYDTMKLHLESKAVSWSVRTEKLFYEDWMIPSYVAHRELRLGQRRWARPPLCTRLYLGDVDNVSLLIDALRKRRYNHYCCFKIPGMEHLFPSLSGSSLKQPAYSKDGTINRPIDLYMRNYSLYKLVSKRFGSTFVHNRNVSLGKQIYASYSM